MSVGRWIVKNLGSFILAVILAVAVWISAVLENDPIEEKLYPKTVPIEFIGQDPQLVMTNNTPEAISLTLNAPKSIWNRLINEQVQVRAVVDLSGLDRGSYELPITVQVGIRPVEVVSYSPRSVDISMEALASQTLPITLIQRGEPAVGFQAEQPILTPTTAMISGPESAVNQVQELRAVLDLNRSSESIERTLVILAVDANGTSINGLTITPERVTSSVTISQRGGYRNVVVKVVTSGQIATGYRVTNISVFPPAVTVFSADPKLVDDLPGYVDTSNLDLTGATDDIDIRLPLKLPAGVSLVGDQMVEVQVGVAAIEGSVTLSNMKVTVIGLENGSTAKLSPETVDVILSGPLPVLDTLNANNVQVVLDLTDMEPGTHQIIPTVEFGSIELKVESILPASVEVTITR